MPLTRLWNALTRRSSEDKATAQTSLHATVEPTATAAPHQTKAADRPSRQTRRKVDAGQAKPSASTTVKGGKKSTDVRVRIANVSAAAPPASKKPAKRVECVDRKAAKRTHAALLKRLGKFAANSIVEIGVDDGTRAVALAVANGESDSIHYVAIDHFESQGGNHLLQFHQCLRRNEISARVLPGPIQNGVANVLRTIGTVDLVIVDTDAEGISDDPLISGAPSDLLGTVARICHPNTKILLGREQQWQLVDSPLQHRRNAA